jgi:hypothetical protein
VLQRQPGERDAAGNSGRDQTYRRTAALVTCHLFHHVSFLRWPLLPLLFRTRLVHVPMYCFCVIPKHRRGSQNQHILFYHRGTRVLRLSFSMSLVSGHYRINSVLIPGFVCSASSPPDATLQEIQRSNAPPNRSATSLPPSLPSYPLFWWPLLSGHLVLSVAMLSATRSCSTCPLDPGRVPLCLVVVVFAAD